MNGALRRALRRIPSATTCLLGGWKCCLLLHRTPPWSNPQSLGTNTNNRAARQESDNYAHRAESKYPPTNAAARQTTTVGKVERLPLQSSPLVSKTTARPRW